MTLGEKLQDARKRCGLTQEQLAEKLSVSRSAVAKWESGKGLPDVDNLKSLAGLLNVSVDYLLDGGETVDAYVLREAVDLSDYGTGSRKKKKDRLIREKFPEARIRPLIAKQKLTRNEKIIDNVLGFVFAAPFGVPQTINDVKSADRAYYLVDQDDRQLFVCVTDEFIETRQLARPFTEKKFEVGGWEFTKCSYEIP